MIYYLCTRRHCYKHRDGFKANPDDCAGCSALCKYEPRFKPYFAIDPARCKFWPNVDDCPKRTGGGCLVCDCVVWVNTPEKEDVIIQNCEKVAGGEKIVS